jgi:four helix bundle protein
MEKEYFTINKIAAYQTAFTLSNYIWKMVATWEKFERSTIGQQVVRSADSISANIAEGFGRYHKKDKIKFYRYSFGSMEETKDWIRKCIVREIIREEDKVFIIQQLDKLPQEINHLINYTNDKLKY